MTEKMYRLVVERSNMSNNDEVIQYVPGQNEEELRETIYRKGHKVVVFRPVFPIEISDGLIISDRQIHMFDEKSPPITQFLDSLFWLKSWVDLHKDHDIPLTFKRIIYHYTMNYYDCMSEGLKKYDAALFKELMEVVKDEVDMDMEVYPNEKGWYTLRDFLASIHPPDITDLWNKLRQTLPPLKTFLLNE